MITTGEPRMGAVQTEPVYHVELVDGREIEKPLPKKWHILIQTYLTLALNRDLLPNDYRALPELNVLTGGRTADGRREYIIPDLVITQRSARYEDGDLAEAPLWGVEILSPGQTMGDLFVRAERLLKLGCPLVWVIWPEKRKAWEYSLADLREVESGLTACLTADANTEPRFIRIQLAEMWAELE